MSDAPVVKLCGFRTEPEVRAAVRAGADWIGLNLHPPSIRAVTPEEAAELAQVARDEASTTGRSLEVVTVLVDPSDDVLERVVDLVRPDRLQWHGDEPPDRCAEPGLPFLKAHRLRAPADVVVIPAFLDAGATAFLVDAWAPDAHGGTGRRLDLELARAALTAGDGARGLLAGGLTPSNVAEAIAALGPGLGGVDVASGVEEPRGVKHAARMNAFVAAARAAWEGMA